MQSRARALAVVGVTLAASSLTLAGCDLFLGIKDHDVTSDAGGARVPDAVAADASVDATHPVDATSHDAARDAVTDRTRLPTEGSVDAGVDGPIDAPVDVPPVCAPDADFTADPANCGRCGHDCIDAGCVLSVCQPKQVSVGTGTPGFLTVAGGYVYWTQASSGSAPNAILVAATGGENATLIVSIPTSATGVATDSHRLYWGVPGSYDNASPYGVFACPLGGCTDAGPALVAPATSFDSSNNYRLDSVNGFAVAGGVVYMALQSSSIKECQVPDVDGGCRVVATGANNSGLVNPNSPAADDAGVVWANQGQMYQYTSGSIETCPPSSECPSPAYATDSIQPVYLAIHGNHLVWTETVTSTNGKFVGNVMSCLRDSCSESLVTLAVNQVMPQGIATDGTRAYWADMTAGTVLSCPLDGCPDAGPTVLATTDAGMPFQVALDSRSVYWTNQVQSGAIMRVAKP